MPCWSSGAAPSLLIPVFQPDTTVLRGLRIAQYSVSAWSRVRRELVPRHDQTQVIVIVGEQTPSEGDDLIGRIPEFEAAHHRIHAAAVEGREEADSRM